MILYQSSAIEFRESVDNNRIIMEIENKFQEKIGKRVSPNEKSSWNNSLRFMESIVRNSKVPNDCGVLIEYSIPLTSKRIDFIISGHNQEEEENFVIIELKQWNEAKATLKEDIVQTFIGGAVRDITHPSYQAWSYRQSLSDMNEAVYKGNIKARSCAYLHNYIEQNPEPLKSSIYEKTIREAPLYFSQDAMKLQEFIYRYVGKGKGLDILYRIENGKIKPSKKLIDSVASMFEGNEEFILLDEQKVAYSTIIDAALNSKTRKTIIVKGGPGTGKSVVSMNSFFHLLKNEKNLKFVAPNSAFRTVLVEMLIRNHRKEKMRMSNLFSGSGQYYDTQSKYFDILIVDEAHRLKKKGAYMYKGENQVEDIIKASTVNVFFIDDTQRIRPDDIGSVMEIKRIAKIYSSEIVEIELEAQFRCAGAEGFINWIDHTLQIRDTGNYDGWDQQSFQFVICSSPHEVYKRIKNHNDSGVKARMLAGFAWKWTAEGKGNRNGEIEDVEIKDQNFRMPWNARSSSTTWAVAPDGIDQIGCIHTSQGLEFDYVGVILGRDIRYDPVKMEVYASYDDYYDSVGKKGMRNKPEQLNIYIKNIYKVLMSRGMKGCYIYCCDENLAKHLRERMNVMR